MWGTEHDSSLFVKSEKCVYTSRHQISILWSKRSCSGLESQLCVSSECGVSCSVVSDSFLPHELSSASSSVHGILQARILEWVSISSSRGSSQPRDQTWVSCTEGRFFTFWATREALSSEHIWPLKLRWQRKKQTVRRVYSPWFLSHNNKDLKWRTLKPPQHVTVLRSWTDPVVALRSQIDRVIALRKISVIECYSSILFRR